MKGRKEITVVSYEYPEEWDVLREPYYPVNDVENVCLYKKYVNLAKTREDVKDVIFGGRLGSYCYYDMDKVIEAAFELARKEKIFI